MALTGGDAVKRCGVTSQWIPKWSGPPAPRVARPPDHGWLIVTQTGLLYIDVRAHIPPCRTSSWSR